MKFKDNIIFKACKFKMANNNLCCYDAKEGFNSDVYTYKLDIGVCAMIEFLFKCLDDEDIEIKIWSNSYTNDEGDGDLGFRTDLASKALDFLENRTINDIQSVMVTKYGTGWSSEDWFNFDFENEKMTKTSHEIHDS